jgi:hypothetical protein
MGGEVEGGPRPANSGTAVPRDRWESERQRGCDVDGQVIRLESLLNCRRDRLVRSCPAVA